MSNATAASIRDDSNPDLVFRDGLGDRCVVGKSDSGEPVERFRVIPELASQERVLRERVDRLLNFRHVRFSRLLGVESETLAQHKAVWILSEHERGVRLSDLLAYVDPHPTLVIDVNAVLQVARELLPALAVLHNSRGITHGALALERMVLTPLARVTVVDYALGGALANLGFPRTRLWREFRIAMPPAAGVARFDARADVANVGLAVLALLGGRPLIGNDFPNGIRALLDAAVERLPNGTVRPLSSPLKAWFERTLPIENRRAFSTASDAQMALEEAIKKGAYSPSQGALKSLLQRYEASRAEANRKGDETTRADASARAAGGSTLRVATPSRPRVTWPAPVLTPEEEEAEEIRALEAELARLARLEAQGAPVPGVGRPADAPATANSLPAGSGAGAQVAASPERPAAEPAAAATASTRRRRMPVAKVPVSDEVEIPLDVDYPPASQAVDAPTAVEEARAGGSPATTVEEERSREATNPVGAFEPIASPGAIAAPPPAAANASAAETICAQPTEEALLAIAAEAPAPPVIAAEHPAEEQAAAEQPAVEQPATEPPATEHPPTAAAIAGEQPVSWPADLDVVAVSNAEAVTEHVEHETAEAPPFGELDAPVPQESENVEVEVLVVGAELPPIDVAAISDDTVTAVVTPRVSIAYEPDTGHAGSEEEIRELQRLLATLQEAGFGQGPTEVASLATASSPAEDQAPVVPEASAPAAVDAPGTDASPMQDGCAGCEPSAGDVPQYVEAIPATPVACVVHDEPAPPSEPEWALTPLTLDDCVAPAEDTVELQATARDDRTPDLDFTVDRMRRYVRRLIAYGVANDEWHRVVAVFGRVTFADVVRLQLFAASAPALALQATIPIRRAAIHRQVRPMPRAALADRTSDEPAAMSVRPEGATDAIVRRAPGAHELFRLTEAREATRPSRPVYQLPADAVQVPSSLAWPPAVSSLDELRDDQRRGSATILHFVRPSDTAPPPADEPPVQLLDVRAGTVQSPDVAAINETLLATVDAPAVEDVPVPWSDVAAIEETRVATSNAPVEEPAVPLPDVPVLEETHVETINETEQLGENAVLEERAAAQAVPPFADAEWGHAGSPSPAPVVAASGTPESETIDQELQRLLESLLEISPARTRPAASPLAGEIDIALGEPPQDQFGAPADGVGASGVMEVEVELDSLLAAAAAAEEGPAEQRERRIPGRDDDLLDDDGTVVARQPDAVMTPPSRAAGEPAQVVVRRRRNGKKKRSRKVESFPSVAPEVVDAPREIAAPAETADEPAERPIPYEPWRIPKVPQPPAASAPPSAPPAVAPPAADPWKVETAAARAAQVVPFVPPAVPPVEPQVEAVVGVQVVAVPTPIAEPVNAPRASKPEPPVRMFQFETAAPAEPAPSPAEAPAPRRVNWRRTAAACLAVMLLEGVAFATVYWFVKPSELGTLLVQTSQNGVEVLIDGHRSGVTPLKVQVEPGRHTLEMRGFGHTKVVPVEISPGVHTTQTINWTSASHYGSLNVRTVPPGARITVDGVYRGTAPVAVADLPVGTHTILAESPSGSVKSTATVNEDIASDVEIGIFSGWLTVFAPVEVRVFEGGKLLGTSLDGKLLVPPGVHQIEIVNKRLGYRETRKIEVEPGKHTALSIEPPNGTLVIDAPDGAEVTVDGQAAGTMPVPTLSVPIGTREIVLKHASFGQRRVTVTVTADAPARVSMLAPQ